MARLDRLSRVPLTPINGVTPHGSSSPGPETPCPTAGSSTRQPQQPAHTATNNTQPSQPAASGNTTDNRNPRPQLVSHLADDDDLLVRPRKRKLTRAEKKEVKRQAMTQSERDDEDLQRIGRLFGKFCCPFTPVPEVFAAGAKLEKNGADALSRPEKYKAAQWLDIKERFPEIVDLLQRRGRPYVTSRLHQHRTDMIAEDVQRVKIHIAGWYAWDPVIPATDAKKKSLRGLKHNGMATLLMPQKEDWKLAAVKLKYAPGGDESNGTKLSPTELPRLLFPAADPEEKKAPGLLRGEVLVTSARGLLLGPGSAEDRQRKGPRGCLAAKYTITDVTTTFMAYVACIVRFAISSERKFGQNGEHGFNYVAFFHRILKAVDKLENMGTDGEGLDLMLDIKKEWESALFADAVYSESEEESDDDADEDMAARYSTFIAEKRARLAEAAADDA